MRYRLPDALGGHPVKLTRRSSNPNEMSQVLVELADESFPLLIHLMVLVEVEEQLPEEPADGTVWLSASGGFAGATFARHDGWPNSSGDQRWYSDAGGGIFAWADIAGADLRQLVPDPFAEPVQLPWKFDDGTRRAKVDRGSGVSIYLRDQHDDVVQLNWMPEVARNAARALWAAAAEPAEELPAWERELLEGQP